MRPARRRIGRPADGWTDGRRLPSVCVGARRPAGFAVGLRLAARAPIPVSTSAAPCDEFRDDSLARHAALVRDLVVAGHLTANEAAHLTLDIDMRVTDLRSTP